MKKFILTICNGNIHRSVIAEQVIRKSLFSRELTDEYEVESRGIQGSGGTGPAKHSNIRDYPEECRLTFAALQPYEIEIPADKVSTPISRTDAERAAVILVMDEKTLRNPTNGLEKQFPDLKHKMILLTDLGDSKEILPDPHGVTNPEIYKNLVRVIHDSVSKNLDKILAAAR
jgi:protein-tyrosine-phosphatase